jgi:hypothetical protein
LALDRKEPYIEERDGKVSENELVENLKEPFQDAWNKIGEARQYASTYSLYFNSDLSKRLNNLMDTLSHDCIIFVMSSSVSRNRR